MNETTYRDAARAWLRIYDDLSSSARRHQQDTAKHRELLVELETFRNEVGIARGYPSFHSRRNTANIHFIVHGTAAMNLSVAGLKRLSSCRLTVCMRLGARSMRTALHCLPGVWLSYPPHCL